MFVNHSIVNFENPIKVTGNERSCNGCTSCCEGWLTCNIYGYEVAYNKPCRFLVKGQGCSAYEMRPYNPCKTFYCYWKHDSTIPEKFKPSVCKNVMVYRQSAEGVLYLDLVEAGKPISIELLNWALMRFRKGKVDSVRWWVDGKMNYVSRDQRFIEIMEDKLKEFNQVDE